MVLETDRNNSEEKNDYDGVEDDEAEDDEDVTFLPGVTVHEIDPSKSKTNDPKVTIENGSAAQPGCEKSTLLSIQTEQELEEWVPDGGWGWGVVVGGIIVHIFIGGYMKSSGVLYIKLKEEFNQGAAATAWVFSLFTTFLLMMGPVASALCHRFSCRTVVNIGGVLATIGIILSAFAPNLGFLYFSYSVVGGFGRCLTYTPSLIILTQYFNKRRGLAVGIATAGVGLGMFSFPPLIAMQKSVLIKKKKPKVQILTNNRIRDAAVGQDLHIEGLFSHYGYQGAMLLFAGISLQSFVCAALFRPLDLHKKIAKTQRINDLVRMARRGSVDARNAVKAFSKPKVRNRLIDGIKGDNWHGSNVFSSTTEFTYVVPEPRRKSVFYEKMTQIKGVFKPSNTGGEKRPLFELSLLKDFPFLSLCLAIMLFTMSMMSTFVFLPPLAKSKGVSQMQSAYLVSIIGVSDSVARFTSGFVLDLKRIKPYRVLVYNGVMFGVGIVSMLMPSVQGFAGFAAVSACYGVLAGTYVAQKSVVVVDILGLEKMTSSFGLLLGFQGIGSLFGPTISGVFRDVFGTYDEAFYFGGIGIFFGGIVLLCGNIVKIVRDRKKKRQQDIEGKDDKEKS